MKRRLSLLDAGFVHLESHDSPQHGSILLIFKMPEGAPADYMRRLFQQMREHAVTAEPFNYCLEPGWKNRLAPTWSVLPPDRIDLDYHLRHSALPQPGGELELGLLVSRLATHPLDMRRPPWEMHLIEGLAGRRFALFAKVHHAVLDGMTVSRILQDWLSKDRNATGIQPLWARDVPVRPARPSRPRATALPARSFFTEVAKAAQAAVTASLGHGTGLVAPYTAPRALFNQRITQRRRVSTQRLALARVQRLADRIDGTLNDAVTVIAGGAVRRYLLEMGALPERSLVASVLASLRGKSTAAATEPSGNQISFIFADLATDTHAAKERAERVRASTSAGKKHLLGMERSAATAYSGLMTAPFMLSSLAGVGHRVRPLSNLAISNVPGTRVPVYLNGAEAEALHATTIIFSGNALVITVTSWADQLCFTFTTCPDVVPHSQRLSLYIVDALSAAEAEFGLSQEVPATP